MLFLKTCHLATFYPLILPALCQSTYPDCTTGPLSTLPICNTTLPPRARAQSLVSALTLPEKINNTAHEAAGAPRLNLPPYNWWNEALHGVAAKHGVTFEESGEYSYATSFPAPIVLGAAFNDALVHQVAAIISTEARAFSNSDHAGLDYWTPNVNPFKDPRWGRGQETPGEDPLHCSRYVKQFVDGMQGDAEHPKVLATCKHLAAYDLEEWGGTSRFEFDARVSIVDLLEYYLPPFKTCAVDANVGAFMCSYNALNGVPACADGYLLQTVLREHWGWEGDGHWVTGDCGAIERIQTEHHYVETGAEAAAAAMNAGVDLDCGTWLPTYLGEAEEQGLVSEETLDTALTRLYTSLVQLGYFDPAEDQQFRGIGWEDVATKQAEDLARRVATQGTVLLKNDGVLPLEGNGTLALIGPFINYTTELQSNYAGPARYIPTMIEAAAALGYNVLTAQGTEVNSTSTDGFADALNIAAQADAVIFFGGIDLTIEEESLDRTRIDWPGNQEDVILELADTGKPLTVVQFGGGQVDDSALLASDGVGAIIWVGYPSQSGGAGVFDVLTGKVAPAGRLPITQYPKAYVDEVTMTDMNLRPGPNNPGRTYRWYEDAVLPFGYGLHYTTFNVSWAKSEFGPYDASTLAAGDYPDSNVVDTFSLAVTNTGNVPSDYVALVFASAPDVGPETGPIKVLVGYSRASEIRPGETRKVDVEVTVAPLARGTEDGRVVLYPGKYTLLVDVNENYPTAAFEITGDVQVLEEFPLPGNGTA
ncbi:putative beta-xylosidase [Aspergillus mulundensis]|uniref:xylan 1,4-beta-xylosidase n=1 Tax=Aspergillus mulundensis TaxID=1810919 RepID=A0A3D8R446_9EURO|nr:Exo-1,4-beta-xylosidase bxlB [Aspergillus mulundensis]RDW68832.1 Exo-1,4-beta-xylosidase bxlB [Aspergillus mulundensis]